MLVRRVRLHARTATRTSSTPAARTPTAQTIANKRGVVLSTDAGVTGTDMTFDGTDMLHPNGLHPDQHDIVTNPNNPFQFFETNDGGVMRSSGTFVDRSTWCDDPNRGLIRCRLARCQQMLSRIPSKLESLNKGLYHAAVPEPVGQPAQQQDPAGRHPGQRHLGVRRQPEQVEQHDDR